MQEFTADPIEGEMSYEEKNAALDAIICPLPNPRYTIDAPYASGTVFVGLAVITVLGVSSALISKR